MPINSGEYRIAGGMLKSARRQGGLYLVATPVGNLGDITIRALETLAGVDLVLCEDTRITRRLTERYAITTPLQAYHEHNAKKMRPRIIERIKSGAAVALVSDAGTPLVSDPGYKLVRALIKEKLFVTSLPGASAVMLALTLSGLPPDRFLFCGFLPPKSAARRSALEQVRACPASLVFFESPKRLSVSLNDMAQILGKRQAAIARELTKLHEELLRGTLDSLAEHYAGAGAPKGEIVIVTAPPLAVPELELDTVLRNALAKLSVRDAAAEAAQLCDVARKTAYARALELRKSTPEK